VDGVSVNCKLQSTMLKLNNLTSRDWVAKLGRMAGGPSSLEHDDLIQQRKSKLKTFVNSKDAD